jgi:DNA-binding transcriptional LysR family regulator
VNWDDVRIFLAVARAGQMLAAARHLGLNHATVARRMTALESSLRTKLVMRRTTGTELTPAGEDFLLAAERMEAEMLAARGTLGDAAVSVRGVVRVGAPDGFGVAFLAPRLGWLCAEHPDLSVQLVPVPRSFSLSRREADIAITTERPTEGRLVAAKLVDYTLGLFASKSYVARHGLPRHRGEIPQHSLVGYVPDLIVSPSLDYAAEFHSQWRARFTVSSALGQVEAVRAGAGIGILHSFIARAHDDLVAVDTVPVIRRAYWLVYHDSMRGLPRIRAVADFVAGAVERERALFQ